MNKISMGLLSAAILLNTACSPKQQETSSGSLTSSSSIASTTSSDMMSSASSDAMSSAQNKNLAATSLTNTYWRLIMLLDLPVEPHDTQREPHILLTNENGVTGSDGCNTISGSYKLENEKLSFSELAGTKMACADAGDHTQLFNDVITKTTHYTLHADHLELRDAANVIIAKFESASRP